MKKGLALLLVFAVGCAGVRFCGGQGRQNYGLSTCELMVLDTIDQALNEIESQIATQGLPPGKTASLEVLGIYSPEYLHPYVRRLVSARLENRGLKIVREKKLVREGTRAYKDKDFDWWSASVTQTGMGGKGTGITQRLLFGARALLTPPEGKLPDLRLVLALRVAGVDLLRRDIFIFEEQALQCRVHAKLYIFSAQGTKVLQGKADSPKYVFRRRLLRFIPLPAPYKELEMDRRSTLRKLLDGIFGTQQAVQMAATPPALPAAGG